MQSKMGAPTRKGRGGRPVLGPIQAEQPPKECQQLPGSEQVSHSANEAENQMPLSPAARFEAALWADRNAWSLPRLQMPDTAEGWLAGRGFGHGKIDKRKAESLLRRACACIDGEALR